MKEVFEKIIARLELKALGHSIDEQHFSADGWDIHASQEYNKYNGLNEAIEIVNQVAAEYGDGWIPCSRELPPQPKENPLFENKPLELYLVSVKNADYPFRAFWNGKFFTDGWGEVEVIAWRPLPEPYQLKESAKWKEHTMSRFEKVE